MPGDRAAGRAGKQRLSADEARRLAIASQGFGRGGSRLSAVVDRLGMLQIDSVNVVERAHYLTVFARVGPYDRTALDRLSHYSPRRLFEYWGHEASLIPVATQPLLRWRMTRAVHEAWGGMRRVADERPELLERILAEVAERGPLAASAIAEERPRRTGPWWDWSDVKRGFEFLFWSGRLTTARRRNFTRLYDLPERVLPRAVLDAPTPPEDEALRGLVRIAARALGVATARDLRDYFRLPATEGARAVAEVAEAGELVAVRVEGWDQQAYLHPEAIVPRRVDARALIGPFDPLIWE